MPSCNDCSSLNWVMTEGAFILYRDGRPCGSMVQRPSGYDVDIESYLFQLSKKGLILPRLNITGQNGQEIGKVTGLNQFELRIEFANGERYMYRPLKEGLQNYAVFNAQGALVMETQNKTTWKSPALNINLYQKDLSDQECAYLAAISLFILLDRSNDVASR